MIEPIVFPTGPLEVNTVIVPLVENKVLVVDPANCKFANDEDDIFGYLEKNHLEPVAIALTHGHFDHIAGLPSFKRKYDIPIAIHKNDSKMIGSDSQSEQGYALSLMGFGVFLPSVSNLPDADCFFEDGMTLSEVYGSLPSDISAALSQWKVIHTPGHTQGCVCLYNKEQKILISGDTVFYHSWGRTDLPGGNEAQIQKSLRRINDIVEKDTLVYPGHDFFGFELEENI